MSYAKKTELEMFRKDNIYPCKSGYTRDWEYPWAYLNSDLKGKVKILDIGPGNSDFPVFLKNKCHDVSIIDIPNNNPKWGIKEFLKKNPGINYRIEDARKMSWKDETFDRVYCISVLEHMNTRNDIIQTLKEIKRILKKNGLAIFTYDSYIKEFPNLKGLNMKDLTKDLNLKMYKEKVIRTSSLRNEDTLFASKGKFLHESINLGRFYWFTRRLKSYLDIYVSMGLVLQK